MPGRRGSTLKDPELHEGLRKQRGITGFSGKKKAELLSMLRSR